MWNLIHDGQFVIDLFECEANAIVNSSLALEQFNTLTAANARIGEIGLTLSDIEPRPLASTVALDAAKSVAIERVNAAYEAALTQGVTVGDLTLAAGSADQIALGQGLTLINAALLVQAIDASAAVSAVFGRLVTDASGEGHDMTAAAYVSLALAYAAAIGQLQATRAERLAAIAAADSMEQLNQIEVD